MIVLFMVSILYSAICAFCFFSALSIPNMAVIVWCLLSNIMLLIHNNWKVVFNKFSIVYLEWIVLFIVLSLYSTISSFGVIRYNSIVILLSLLGLFLSYCSDKISVNVLINIIVVFSIISFSYLFLEILIRERALLPLAFVFDETALTNELVRCKIGVGFRGLAEFPNVLSLAAGILFWYSLFIMDKDFKRKIILIVSVVIVALTGERSNAILIPLTSIIVYFMFDNRHKLIIIVRVIAILALMILVAYLSRDYLIKFNFFNRLYNTAILYFSGEDISTGRTNLYSTAISQWKKHPFVGNGWFYFYYNNRGILGRDTYVHVHNVILELLCDTGIIGTILYSIPIAVPIIQNIKAIVIDDGKYKSKLCFTLAAQLFYVTDSMLHVTLYSINMIPMYFAFIIIFTTIFKQQDRYLASKDRNNYHLYWRDNNGLH